MVLKSIPQTSRPDNFQAGQVQGDLEAGNQEQPSLNIDFFVGPVALI